MSRTPQQLAAIAVSMHGLLDRMEESICKQREEMNKLRVCCELMKRGIDPQEGFALGYELKWDKRTRTKQLTDGPVWNFVTLGDGVKRPITPIRRAL